MLYTEEEAKIKMCPMRDRSTHRAYCVAAKCMWWEEVHSSAMECMANARMELNKAHGGKLAEIKEEGPCINRVLVIEARGKCGVCK